MNEAKLMPDVADADPPRTEAFLDRWSRVKREVKGGAVPPGTVETTTEAVELPSLDTLVAQGLDADFAPFMQKGVAEATKRAAIQQLFRQPVFNVMDGLDVYIEDFNIYEPLTAAELPGLAHARAMLFPEAEDAETQAPEARQLSENEAENQEAANADEEQEHGRG